MSQPFPTHSGARGPDAWTQDGELGKAGAGPGLWDRSRSRPPGRSATGGGRCQARSPSEMDGPDDVDRVGGLSVAAPCPATAWDVCVSRMAWFFMGAVQPDIHRHASTKAIKNKRMTKRVPGFVVGCGNSVGACSRATASGPGGQHAAQRARAVLGPWTKINKTKTMTRCRFQLCAPPLRACRP